MLEAKDLPHNDLSRYLEGRVYESLGQERLARASKVRTASVCWFVSGPG